MSAFIKKKQPILPREKTLYCFLPFLWIAILGSRCHLAGEESLSSWNFHLRGILGPSSYLEKLKHAFPAPLLLSCLFCPLPHCLILPGSASQHLYLTPNAGTVKRWFHQNKEEMRNLSVLHVFRMNTFCICYSLCSVDIFLPNESVWMLIYWSRHVATQLSSANQNKQKLCWISMWIPVVGLGDKFLFWNISFRSK